MMKHPSRLIALGICVAMTAVASAQLDASVWPTLRVNAVVPPPNWLFGTHENILTNGGFEMPSILGEGQTEVGAFDDSKLIEIDPDSGFWANAISGVRFWDNALQFGGPPPSRSDQGIATYEDIVGTPQEPRYAFINNWNRRFNQTVSTLIEDGVTYTATVEFATRLDNPNQRRAGLFELRAGPMNPDNPDDPGTSILLDAQTAGQSGFYGGADPDVVVTDREFTLLTLNYTPSGPGDPAIGRPLTVTFRTEFGSQGPTFWDNATLAAGGCDPCDMNCDDEINAFDIEPFLTLLFDPNAPPCCGERGVGVFTGDVNGDGVINAFDIEPFLDCLFP